MRYAVGEIVLVVIGILIALSINNWNEDRKEKILKDTYTKQLADNFKKDIIRLEEYVELNNLFEEEGFYLLDYLLNGNLIYNQGKFNDVIKGKRLTFNR